MIAISAQIKPSQMAIKSRSLVQPTSRSVVTPVIGNRRSSFAPRAGKDFDAILMEVADKFEKSDNKVPIAAWSAAAFFAITTAEWFIHLPLFDFLLGFPIQFLGLITAANYGLKFYKGERIDAVDELEGFVNKVSKELPGLGNLAAFFNPKLIERASWLISRPYLAAMSLASLEYWLEQTYVPWIKLPLITNIGIFFVVAGEILRKTGIITAKHNFTHRVQLEYRFEHSLVKNGIYSYMRHPGYAGWVLWAVGTQVMLCNPICTPLFAYVCLRFMKRRISIEDQLLRSFFGEEWVKWKERVPSGLPTIQ